DEERAASMRLIAQCREELGDLREAQSWLYRAVAECPNVREGHLALAKFGYRTGNWAMTYAAVKNALAIASPSGSYLVEPESWGGAPYDYGAIAAYHLGLYAEARAFAQIACAANPDDARLKANLQRIEEKLGESEGEPCAP
ncbi:MAG: glycosyl transferase family 2, partial [Christensenellales bacterium]